MPDGESMMPARPITFVASACLVVGGLFGASPSFADDGVQPQAATLPATCVPSGDGRDHFAGLHLGFPRSPDRAPATGDLKIAVIYVDFEDAPAEEDIASMHARTIPGGLEHLEKLSHGRLDVQATRSPSWIRMPMTLAHYLDNPGIRWSSDFHRDFIADAIAAADSKMSFAGVDIVGVVIETEIPRPPLGIAMPLDKASAFTADGQVIADAFTLMHPLFMVETVVAHEILHNLGLVDLYDGSPTVPQEPGAANGFVGGYSTMGDSREHSPELFAWEQWVLGWVRDENVACVEADSREVRLSAVSTSAGTRLATVPLGSNRFVAFEVRAKHGLDDPPRPGVLPYVVSPDTPTAYGPIRVPRSEGYEVIQPLRVGEQYLIEGVGVEVLSGRGTEYVIRVHKEAPEATAAGAVRNLRAVSGARDITISWGAPLATGWTPITGYEYRIGAGAWIPTTRSTARIPAIKRGAMVTVQVRALNVSGAGTLSTVKIRGR